MSKKLLEYTDHMIMIHIYNSETKSIQQSKDIIPDIGPDDFIDIDSEYLEEYYNLKQHQDYVFLSETRIITAPTKKSEVKYPSNFNETDIKILKRCGREPSPMSIQGRYAEKQALIDLKDYSFSYIKDLNALGVNNKKDPEWDITANFITQAHYIDVKSLQVNEKNLSLRIYKKDKDETIMLYHLAQSASDDGLLSLAGFLPKEALNYLLKENDEVDVPYYAFSKSNPSLWRDSDLLKYRVKNLRDYFDNDELPYFLYFPTFLDNYEEGASISGSILSELKFLAEHFQFYCGVETLTSKLGFKLEREA